jgi:hypothetical protein
MSSQYAMQRGRFLGGQPLFVNLALDAVDAKHKGAKRGGRLGCGPCPPQPSRDFGNAGSRLRSGFVARPDAVFYSKLERC